MVESFHCLLGQEKAILASKGLMIEDSNLAMRPQIWQIH
jgi:hypothetical protein